MSAARRGTRPRGLWAGRHEAEGDGAEQRTLRAARRQLNADAGCERELNPPHLWVSNFPQFRSWRLTSRGMPREVSVVKLGELMMILDLHRQGLTVSAIARRLGMDRKTIRRYIARGLEPPTYGPRLPALQRGRLRYVQRLRRPRWRHGQHQANIPPGPLNVGCSVGQRGFIDAERRRNSSS